MKAVSKLSPRGFGWALGLSVLLFLVVDNPLGDPFDIDASILWSYAIVPILVGGMLLKERKLSFGAWGLESMTVALLKFAITLCITMGPWMFTQPKVKPDAPISTSVGNPNKTVRFGSGGGGRNLLETGEPLALGVGESFGLKSPDEAMHTVLAVRADRQLFNRPVLPQSEANVRFLEPMEVQLHCTVHDRHLRTLIVRAP